MFARAFFTAFLTLSLPLILSVYASTNPQVQQAILKCRTKLHEDPTFPKACHMLGMLLEATGQESDLEEVAELSWRAGNCDDRPLETTQRVDGLLRAGNTFRRLANVPRAIESYQRALTLVEDASVAEDILRIATPLFFQDDNELEASSMNSLFDLATQLTQRFPDCAVVHQFQGAVQRKAGNLQESYHSYHTATTLPQSSLESKIQSLILAAASARHAGRDLNTQLDYLRQSMDLAKDATNQDRAEIWDNMGIAYKAAGQPKEAIRCFQSALKEKPGDGHAAAQLASLGSATSATTTFDSDYVQGLFDGFSSTFEEKLLSLEYEGHLWVVDELMERIPDFTNTTIVDCGSGSGLVGHELANRLSVMPNLIGVDLSPRMVELARVRSYNGQRIYSRVEQGDAENYLKSLDKESVRAVVAADVFIYVGTLDSIFAAAWNALFPSGFLIFSVETTREGMALLPSGRFGHSQQYVRHLSKQMGFDFILWREGNLRNQHGAPVPGAVVVLQKKGKSK